MTEYTETLSLTPGLTATRSVLVRTLLGRRDLFWGGYRAPRSLKISA